MFVQIDGIEDDMTAADPDSANPALTSWVDVYIRGPQSDWKMLQIDQFGEFERT